jgi:hypothetical protein
MQVTYTNVKPIIEGVKEVGRVVVLGIIPIILSGINISTGEIKINWAIVLASAITIVLTALLKGIDKDRHLEGKLEGDDGKTRGLAQF